MLVLTRKLMEKVYIGDDICVTVVRIEGGQVRLGIDAPRDVTVVRSELVPERQPPGRGPKVPALARVDKREGGPPGPEPSGEDDEEKERAQGSNGPYPVPITLRVRPSWSRGTGSRRPGPSR